MTKAVFLDRDGVINKVILKNDKPLSPRRIEDFEISDGIREFLLASKSEGFLNIAVTNQPDIARGLMSWETLEKMHKLVRDNLPIDDIFVCYHHDSDNCNCRKPKPGLLLEAAQKWEIDLRNSFMIGDQWKDMEAGWDAGCTTILLDRPYNQGAKSDFRTKDLLSTIEIILGSRKEAQQVWTIT